MDIIHVSHGVPFLSLSLSLFFSFSLSLSFSLFLFSEPETQVLDYQTQQYKLLPLIATAYAMTFTGVYIFRKHVEVRAEISEGNLDSLPEV